MSRAYLNLEKEDLDANPRNPRHKAKAVSAASKVGDKAKDIASDLAPSKQDQSDLESRSVRGRVKDMVKAINDNNHPGFKYFFFFLALLLEKQNI